MFAASSTKNAVDEAIEQFARASGIEAVASYAATSVLARQISRGAPADLVIAADAQWMNYLQTKQLVHAETRVNLASNQLVLIGSPGYRFADGLLPIRPNMPLSSALGRNERLALADPRHVPAGRYAKAALQSLQVWEGIAARVAPATNVRHALALVARGESPLGIVYASDVLAATQSSPGSIRQLAVLPQNLHPVIEYPAALVRRTEQRTQRTAQPAAALLAFLASSSGREIFLRYGFVRSVR